MSVTSNATRPFTTATDLCNGIFEQPPVRCTPSILECAQSFALQRHHLHLVTHGEIERPTWTTTWTGCRANHLRQSLECDSLSALNGCQTRQTSCRLLIRLCPELDLSPWPNNGSAHDIRLGDLTEAVALARHVTHFSRCVAILNGH